LPSHGSSLRRSTSREKKEAFPAGGRKGFVAFKHSCLSVVAQQIMGPRRPTSCKKYSTKIAAIQRENASESGSFSKRLNPKRLARQKNQMKSAALMMFWAISRMAQLRCWLCVRINS
jgi:hypothetical protein